MTQMSESFLHYVTIEIKNGSHINPKILLFYVIGENLFDNDTNVII